MTRGAASRMTANLRESWFRRRVSRTARAVKAEGLTYLSYVRLRRIHQALERVDRMQVPGLVLEAGVALGGSGMLLAKSMGVHRRFRGYDLFGTIPPPGDKDGEKAHHRYELIRSGSSRGLGGDEYYGYMNGLFGRVVENFATFGVPVDGERISLVPGLFEDTLKFNEGERIALAHIDCDWHDAVDTCLKRVYPILNPGGIIVVDDYHDYEGCRLAVDAFLSRTRDVRVVHGAPNMVIAKDARDEAR